ncbi:MAG: peptidase, partial [Planctomycetota bacterium]
MKSTSESTLRSLGLRSGGRPVRRRAADQSATTGMRRKALMETLESRQLLAGPQLIGIQPNQGELIVDGTVRNEAPRVLTFRFDQEQDIDPATYDGIRISRAGEDGVLGSNDDVQIEPGLVTAGDGSPNEVVVRFANALPDDQYRVEVFGFDDPGRGIVGLRNQEGEFLQPAVSGTVADVIDFDLQLGALVESVVPQPVVRNADGSLSQNRDEIVVYFNEDPLFVEDDANGNPTERSAENPRFYQLLLTHDSVRTTDDVLYFPDSVVYDEATHTARLFFADDINQLPGVPVGGGTFRLRIGTAVDQRVDLILEPTQVDVAPSARIDVEGSESGLVIRSRNIGEGASGQRVRFEDTGSGGASVVLDSNNEIVFDLGGDTPTISELRLLVQGNVDVDALITLSFDSATGGVQLPAGLIGGSALTLEAAGDTLSTAVDVGTFGADDSLASLVYSEAIDPQQTFIQLPGSNEDPGHRPFDGVSPASASEHIWDAFGADLTDGITEISYNFNGIFDRDTQGNAFVNQITERSKDRIREALGVWSSQIGVQFRETVDEGITFAVGDIAQLQPTGSIVNQTALGFRVRRDPTFDNAAVVFSNQTPFETNYGEDFYRKTMAAIGFAIGLEEASDLPPQTLMALDFGFLNASLDPAQSVDFQEPVFPGNFDVLHGQFLHNPNSNDVDLYRFEVDLGDPNKAGVLTAETFAERLSDASGLDTTLTLFEEVPAAGRTDFGIGPDLSVEFEFVQPGRLGNGAGVDFILSNRADTSVRVFQPVDASNQPVHNRIVVDLPRNAVVPVGDVIDAINNDPVASRIFRAQLIVGDASTDIGASEITFQNVSLTGGGITQVSRNDDYFSEDSRVVATLDSGVYYVGVAASGNNQYDPEISRSGQGGLTQGRYELSLKFEPQVDETDVIRDRDGVREGVPGTSLDGDGDGVAGGVNQFWFQTRSLNRVIDVVADADAITAGQTMTVVGADGSSRTYEFVPNGGQPRVGNIAIRYTTSGFPTPAGSLAGALAQAINTQPGVNVSLSATTLTLTGERSISFSEDFRGVEVFGRNIFVDKTAGPFASGGLDSPFNNISNSAVANAFDAALPGDIVRIVGNGGADRDIATEADNFSYKIGVSDTGGVTLEDGRNMEVPQGVTTMVDAGAVFKLRGSRIGVGSSSVQIDRSNGALQVLGTPRLVQLSLQGEEVATTLIGDDDAVIGNFSDGDVIFTSIRDAQADAAATGQSLPPSPGNWGGLVFRRDLDQQQGRLDLEDEGIFLQHVNHADIRYGGSSNLFIDSVQQLVNPIQLNNLRPNISFNTITQSADAAISASPNSFEETSFQSPRFQQAGAFTADYDRVGPTIRNNQIVDNSINGLFVRAETTSNAPTSELEVAGRLDDIDVVHFLSENIVVAGTPGGSIQDGIQPSLATVSSIQLPGGSLEQSPIVGESNYEYRLTFVDAFGFESLGTDSADAFQLEVTNDASAVELTGLPLVSDDGLGYVSRRLYRAVTLTSAGVPIPEDQREYILVADLNASSRNYVDDGSFTEGRLDLERDGIRGRLDGSLVIDPGVILKLQGSRIELGQGTNLIAEGLRTDPVVFTSSLDDRFGAGGTFDTNNDNETGAGPASPSRGDWSGIYAAPTARVSMDNAVVAYGGGISLIEGGQARGFAPIELQQAEGRITNTRFEFNESGQDGSGDIGREGRLNVEPSVIFGRGTQPIIVGNTFIDNRGAVVNLDSESLTDERLTDYGRQTGASDQAMDLEDNYGPLIRRNRYDVVAADETEDQQLSGLEIRAGVTVTSGTIFDDTDIVHVLRDGLTVGNFHSAGGLRLQSRVDESLVV